MNNHQENFVEVVREFEEAKKNLKAVSEKLDLAMQSLNIGETFQDPLDGVVYRIDVPLGTFVEFRTKGYSRTRREGEAKGTLSMKDAEAAGFKVKL
jgi:hypothetical protein